MKGRVHSFQSLGTVDGPGVRFVVFLQGCPLRCKCCHNPDTWAREGGEEYTPEEILAKVLRYRDYFGERGGITLSGGEPLLQSAFAYELFSLCKEQGIHTCLDTAGCLLREEDRKLLTVTDHVLLDIKYTNEMQYLANVGCTLSAVLDFLAALEQMKIPTTLRQVIIPSINDSELSMRVLRGIATAHSCVQKVELLPFKRLCQAKYDNMRIPFPFAGLEEPTMEEMERLRALL